MEIQCWISSHEHPLRLNESIICRICDSHSAGDSPFYACNSCPEYHVHKSCAGPPHQIRHPFHPHYPLTLVHKQSFLCNSCLHEFQDSQLYKCQGCDFQLDAGCALMPLAISGSEGRDWIRHLSHPHPLLLVEDPQERGTKCFGCKSTSRDSGLAYYGCSKCDYFLDKSCIDIPPEIHLPLHQNHRGTLVLSAPYICDACEIQMGDRYNLAYSCSSCLFRICPKCAKEKLDRGSFKYEDHDHLLCLENSNIDDATSLAPCDGYDSYCTQRIVGGSDEFSQTRSTMLWCYQCGFRVHLLCGPLPSTVKYEFHIHSLDLLDSMHEDDTGEYYCDICETERDPRIRLYSCRECKYFAHVHCLIPEIMKVLGGDLNKAAKLKAVGQDIWNVPNAKLKIENLDPPLTLKDFLNGLSEDEKELLRRSYKWDETSSEEDRKSMQEDDHDNHRAAKAGNPFKVRDEEIDEILDLSRFTHGSFGTLCSNLRDHYEKNKEELKPSDLRLKMVRVGDYMIPYCLAPVLHKLLNQFDDIVKRATGLSPGSKSFGFFVVCRVVKRMHGTMAQCVTKPLLQEWYFNLRFASQLGFGVDFALARLELLLHAFLGFQARRLEEEIPKILNEGTAELQTELQCKLDKCKEYRDSSPKSEYMEYCLNKASEFEWSDALGDSLSRKTSTEATQWTLGFEFCQAHGEIKMP